MVAIHCFLPPLLPSIEVNRSRLLFTFYSLLSIIVVFYSVLHGSESRSQSYSSPILGDSKNSGDALKSQAALPEYCSRFELGFSQPMVIACLTAKKNMQNHFSFVALWLVLLTLNSIFIKCRSVQNTLLLIHVTESSRLMDLNCR